MKFLNQKRKMLNSLLHMNKKKLITIIFIMLFLSYDYVCLAAGDLSKLDSAGTRILKVTQHIGYWIILVKGLMDLIKAFLSGDKSGAGRIAVTSVLVYASLFFLPWALRLVEGVF